jgi:glutaredoxin
MSTNRAEDGPAGKDAFPPVVVYTGNDCYWCERAKQYLSGRGVPYEERNVEENEAYGPEVINLSGQRHVPVIVVGSHAVVGFKKPELDAELDALLGVPAPAPANKVPSKRSHNRIFLDPRA